MWAIWLCLCGWLWLDLLQIKYLNTVNTVYNTSRFHQKSTVFGFIEFTHTKHQSTYLATLGFYLCMGPNLSAFTHMSKSEYSPFLGWMYPANIPVRAGGSLLRWKLPVTSGDQPVWLAAAFYTFLQATVYQSQL